MITKNLSYQEVLVCLVKEEVLNRAETKGSIDPLAHPPIRLEHEIYRVLQVLNYLRLQLAKFLELDRWAEKSVKMKKISRSSISQQ